MRICISALITAAFSIGAAQAQSIKDASHEEDRKRIRREQGLAEAMAHADRTVTEYAGYTVITEIISGIPTIYYFSKPDYPPYPTWLRIRIFADGISQMSSCDTCKRKWPWGQEVDAQINSLTSAYQKIMHGNSN